MPHERRRSSGKPPAGLPSGWRVESSTLLAACLISLGLYLVMYGGTHGASAGGSASGSFMLSAALREGELSTRPRTVDYSAEVSTFAFVSRKSLRLLDGATGAPISAADFETARADLRARFSDPSGTDWMKELLDEASGPVWSGARVRWDGLVLTSAGAVLFLIGLCSAVHSIRLRRASRLAARGQCPWCRYEILGLDQCPECGWERGASIIRRRQSRLSKALGRERESL